MNVHIFQNQQSADEYAYQLFKQAVDNAGFGFKSHIEDPAAWLNPFGWTIHEALTLEDVGRRLGRDVPRTEGPPRSWAVCATK